MFQEFINAYGVEIAYAILVALAGLLGRAVKKLYEKHVNTKVKKDIARIVVRGVEQLYKDLNGAERLAKALEAASEMLEQNGIFVTDLELRMLLEDAVGEFNDVFNQGAELPGIAVEDLTDEQLRDVLEQMGASVGLDCSREDMLYFLDNIRANE